MEADPQEAQSGQRQAIFSGQRLPLFSQLNSGSQDDHSHTKAQENDRVRLNVLKGNFGGYKSTTPDNDGNYSLDNGT